MLLPCSCFRPSRDEHDEHQDQQIDEARTRNRRRSNDATGGSGYRRLASQISETNSDSGGTTLPSRSIPRRDLPSITPVAFWHVVSGGPARSDGSAGPGAKTSHTASEASSQAMAVLPRAAGGSLTNQAAGSAGGDGGVLPFLESARIDSSSSTYAYLVIMRCPTSLRVALESCAWGGTHMTGALPCPRAPDIQPPLPPFGTLPGCTGGKLHALRGRCWRARW